MRTLYILSHDLRIHDNRVLEEAAERNDIIFPIFLKDPKIEKLSGASLWWVKSSLIDLAHKFGIERIPIVESSGDYIPVLKEIIVANRIERIVSQSVPYARVRNAFGEIHEYFRSKGVGAKMCKPNNLLSDEMIMNMKINFGNFKQFYRSAMDMKFDLDEGYTADLPEFSEINAINRKIEFSSWERNLAKYWNTGEEAASMAVERLMERGLENENAGLSPYIRHGQINIRNLWEIISRSEDEEVSIIKRNLLWREFFYCSYARRPDSGILSINRRMDSFPWSGQWKDLIDWKEGKTGFPIIDAIMRKLWQTGWIDNRKRLLVSDFLTKMDRIKWTYGAEWFMDTLVDADEANNYSSWQWVSGCSDFSWAYFRIYNPLKNGAEIDPEGKFIRKWVEELSDCPVESIHDPEHMNERKCNRYRRPELTYKEMREKSLSVYKKFIGEREKSID